MAKEIVRNLSQRAEEVARYLLPNGKKIGNEWRVGNIDGESGESLGVHLTGEKAGIWSDFATGNSGDLLNLWVQSRNLTNYEAMKEATCYLGISQPHFDAYKASKFAKPKHKLEPLSDKSPVMDYLTKMRKLSPKTILAFQIRQKGNDIVFPYFRDNELIFVKYLKLERIKGKKQMYIDVDCEPCLFGWQMLPPHAHSVIICEGEIDVMTLSQYGLPALSVPFGAGGGNKHAWIEYEFERLAIFDEIFLCMDDDQEGHIATKELIERLGRHRCRVVKLPFNDANECLQSDLADNSFIIWRNKEKERLTQAKESGAILEEKEEKILNAAGCKWICDKQRNGDWEGVLGFWFHAGSLQYLDTPDQKPIRFVEYSKQSVSTA